MRITEVKASTACSPSKLPDIDWALNPYRGCQHGCVYCYAPDVLRMAASEEWGSFVDVRKNVPNLVARERKGRKGVVGLGTVTDPYQPAEEKFMLSRYCLEQLAASECRVCVQTKSDLVTRDIDVLGRMKDPEVGLTVTTMDPEIAALLEPGAPSPERRVAALGRLAEAGIRTWLFLGPVIPTINDSPQTLADVVNAARSADVGKVLYDTIRLRPMLSERMAGRLGHEAMGKIIGMADDREWLERESIEIEILCEEAGITAEKAL